MEGRSKGEEDAADESIDDEDEDEEDAAAAAEDEVSADDDDAASSSEEPEGSARVFAPCLETSALIILLLKRRINARAVRCALRKQPAFSSASHTAALISNIACGVQIEMMARKRAILVASPPSIDASIG